LLGTRHENRKIGPRHWALVGLGFAGILALVLPELRKGTPASVLSVACLIAAPVAWSYAALYIQRQTWSISTFTLAGYQHLFGGLGFLALSLLFREPLPHPTGAAWGALAFLVVLGSVIAFTSYIKALSLLPAHVVTTNTYVNPVIAVFLGWLVLGERLSLWTLLALGLVALSVGGILRNGKVRAVKI
jgi:drug/metabolite transporter (DMT)-like permease